MKTPLRKFGGVISTLIVLSMILAACQAATPVATEAPVVTEAPPATQAPEATQPPSAEKPELSITWFAWPPCDNLAKVVATYPDATVTVNCVPLDRWHDEIFQGYIGKSGADLPIGDSQWTGEEVKGGHLLELTDVLKNDTPFEDFVPAALKAYGEYPPESGRYWGAPIMADVMLLFYNKNIFAEYGLEPAKTLDELLTQAQTIKDGGKYDGFVWFWNGNTDTVQGAWNQIAWSYGGDLWDPKTYKFDGVINSADNLAATEYAANLLATGPEGSGSWGYNEVLDAICTGKAAMTEIWVGFGPSLTDPSSCKEAANLGYAVPPEGPKTHILQLGGMGISISAYTKNKDAAFAFLKWLESHDTQIEWVKNNGYSAQVSVLASPEFQNAQPYNPYFAEAYPLVKDFYNIPEYAELLSIQGKYINLAVTGQMDSKEALDTMAAEMQAVIDAAYPNGPTP